MKALQAKLGEVTGATGIGGAVDSLEAAADLLRGLDLSAVTVRSTPCSPGSTARSARSTRRRCAPRLQAAADAVADLLDLDTLIDPASVVGPRRHL